MTRVGCILDEIRTYNESRLSEKALSSQLGDLRINGKTPTAAGAQSLGSSLAHKSA